MNELIMYYPFRVTIGILIFILGATVGSFSCCYSDRYGKDDKCKRSHCDSCGKTLRPLELIPIFSYIFLKGRCKNCGNKIDSRSFVIEIIAGITYLIIYIRYGFSLQTICGEVLFALLLIPSLIDIRLMIIPNIFPILLFVIWIPYFFLVSGQINIFDSLLGGVLIPGIIFFLSIIMGKILKKETFGMGDVKILIGIGLILGFSRSLINIFIMSLSGILMAIILKKKKGEAFPLMPSICISTMLTYIFGDIFVSAYMYLF